MSKYRLYIASINKIFRRHYFLQVTVISHVALWKTFLILYLLRSLIYTKFFDHLTQPDVIPAFAKEVSNADVEAFYFFSVLCFCVPLPFKSGVTFSLVFIFHMNQHDSLRSIVQNIPNYYTHEVFVRFWVILVRIWFNGLVVRVALDYQFSGSGFETTSWT